MTRYRMQRAAKATLCMSQAPRRHLARLLSLFFFFSEDWHERGSALFLVQHDDRCHVSRLLCTIDVFCAGDDMVRLSQLHALSFSSHDQHHRHLTRAALLWSPGSWPPAT